MTQVKDVASKPLWPDYTKPETPRYYQCCECKAAGCKLWRLHGLDWWWLRCAECAGRFENINVSDMDDAGQREIGRIAQTDNIGHYVPAIPEEETGPSTINRGYITQKGRAWWQSLPNA